MAFPLAFTYTPEGEMLVNYMGCEGQDAPDGEVVDETFVEKTVEEIKKKNPDFFDQLRARKIAEHELLFPLYTQEEVTGFNAKQSAKDALASLLTGLLTGSTKLRASTLAFLRTTDSAFRSEAHMLPKHARRVMLFDDQVKLILEKVSDRVTASYPSTYDELTGALDQYEKQATESGRCQIFWEGTSRDVALDETLETKSLTGERMKAKVSSIFFSRDFSGVAMRKILEHLSENLRRVDLGGFPIDAEISVMLKSLGDYVKNIETFCYLYSPDEEEVSEKTATKVVNDLDTFFVLGSSYARSLGAGLR
jgi:hypothetical protein